VPLFDLKFLNELAASVAGTSNRRHECPFESDRAHHYGLLRIG